MKQFILDRHTVPGTPSLEQVPTEKIPVYDTKTDAEADLANLSVNQLIATKDEGSEISNPVDVVEDGNMHAVTSNAVYNSLGRINVLDSLVYFDSLNTDITVNLTEDIENETVLHLILGTRINGSPSTDVRLCDCPILVSKDFPSYIYNFYEARNNTQVKGRVASYVVGSNQLVLNFFDGTLYPSDDYVVFAVIKG